GGITEEMATQISNALEARELIKVKCLDNSDYTAREAADLLAEATEADVVCVIGNRFVLYRASTKHPKIDIHV
ncbi:MAG: YhbY family RNA-binding protein, partial [Clostridia bacterium]|nr:YhbY family RNA-binding protein [Clostridia bacterium]